MNKLDLDEFERRIIDAFGVTDEEAAFQAGRDAAENGSTPGNCDYRFFATPSLKEAWERGNALGKSNDQT